MNNYVYSDAGIALTKSFEGLKPEAYQDVAGIWTIGYGHTGSGVCEGLLINEDQATQFLIQDLQTAVEAVTKLVTVAISQNQFDALVDFCFNAGQGSLASSTLLRLVNLGDFIGAFWQFSLWVYAGGVIEPGLVTRRKAEASMFRSGVAA
jgi:lysozyme